MQTHGCSLGAESRQPVSHSTLQTLTELERTRLRRGAQRGGSTCVHALALALAAAAAAWRLPTPTLTRCEKGGGAETASARGFPA